MNAWVNMNPLLSRPLLNPTMRVISYGGGTQTITLAEMAARGDIGPMPDAAIMGDTSDEEKSVYDYLKWMGDRLPFPLYLVEKASVLEHIERSKAAPDGRQLMTLPYYLADGGQMQRTCTEVAKISAVTAKTRELLGLQRGQRVPKDVLVEVWIGISMDEKHRAGGFPAERWQEVRYPLLEADMTFGDCVNYLAERQMPKAPRSRCRVCPFRSDESWMAMDAEDFEHACRVDDSLRAGGTPPRGYQSLPYLHRQRKPLREVDFTQPSIGLPLEDDCFGVCGT